ncbi:hypothetical protein [Gulosibacter massiliensis]|uniref:hypothetical protein n=1 Tax=Gulosibacter massiliensis TaxID=2479839 RepID=UPI000F633FAC|nr:hypothetical protein [Gulosibacter massiliensis]
MWASSPPSGFAALGAGEGLLDGVGLLEDAPGDRVHRHAASAGIRLVAEDVEEQREVPRRAGHQLGMPVPRLHSRRTGGSEPHEGRAFERVVRRVRERTAILLTAREWFGRKQPQFVDVHQLAASFVWFSGSGCVNLLVELVRGRRPRDGASVPLPISVEYRASTLGR